MSEGTGFNRTKSVWALYLSFFLIGITVTVYGPAINFLMERYNIGVDKASLFVTFMAMGRLFSVIASGILVDRIGRKPILLAGTACLTLGLFGIGSLNMYTVGLILAIIAGIGHGAVDTAANAAAADMFPGKLSGALNVINAFYGIGCLIGPLISGTILSLGLSGKIVFYINGIIGVFITLFVSVQKYPFHLPELVEGKEPKRFFISSSIILMSLVMFIYSGAGNSINTWINKYMGDVINFSVFFAAGTLSVYNLGITLGRLSNSIISEKIGYYSSILYCSVGSFIAIFMALFSGDGIVIVVSLGIAGFFFGGLFPTVVAIASNMYPDKTGTVSGILVMAASIGSMVTPPFVGIMSNVLGLQGAFRLLVVLVAGLIVIALLLKKKATAAK